jgi:curved DNA-binding protein CbpA
MDHYESLGVDRDADQDTIKKAYKRKAMESHPDRDGGSEQAFQCIQRAYSVLSDPERRKLYDETGMDGLESQEQEESIHEQLGSLFLELVDKVDVEYRNITLEMKQIIQGLLAENEKRINELNSKIEKRKKALQRITRKSGDNVLRIMLERQIAQIENNIQTLKHQRYVVDRMLELVDEYEYQSDVMPIFNGGSFLNRGPWNT